MLRYTTSVSLKPLMFLQRVYFRLPIYTVKLLPTTLAYNQLTPLLRPIYTVVLLTTLAYNQLTPFLRPIYTVVLLTTLAYNHS